MKSFSIVLIAFLLFINSGVFAQSQGILPTDIIINKNGVLLKGKFYESKGEGVFPTVILLPGFPGNMSDVLGLGGQLAQLGINVMTFNYSGTHQSQGMLSFSNTQADIMEALKFIHNPGNIDRFKIDTTFIILGGYSYGGGMAMTYAIKHPEIDRIISIAGNDWGEYFEEYIRNPEMKANLDASLDRAVSSGIVKFAPDEMPKEVTANGLEKLEPSLYLKRNAELLAQKNILIICGWNDEGITIERYILPLYRALQKENARHTTIKAFQDNHTFQNSRNDIVSVIMEWIKSTPESK